MRKISTAVLYTLQYIKSCFQWESTQRSLIAFLVSHRLTLMNRLLALGRASFVPFHRSLAITLFISCELDGETNLCFSHFLSAGLFPMEKKQGCMSFFFFLFFFFSFFYPYVCIGCDLSFESNPTWLYFGSDDIRVYLKGWGLGVCASDSLQSLITQGMV